MKDYDPVAKGPHAVKATRPTEELLNAIVKNDIRLVYKKIEEGADVNFIFADAYGSVRCPVRLYALRALCRNAPLSAQPEGYTPLMSACHRGRYEAAKALLRAGADPNMANYAGDLTIFWAIDGGVELIRILHEYGAELDAKTEKGWTPLQYARARGKYGLVDRKGIYPEDVLRYYGASEYGEGPVEAGDRSPRESFDPEHPQFSRDRGSYQDELAHP